MSDEPDVAELIAAYLFTSGDGVLADHLELTTGTRHHVGHKYHGGWCREAVVQAIRSYLNASKESP